MHITSAELMSYCSTIDKRAVQEEFIAVDGQFDTAYCKQILEDRTMTKGKLNTLVQSAFGQIIFFQLPVENEVTPELFKKHYRFGTYRNVRQWISFFYLRYSLILTRESLFKYVTSQG